MSAAQIAGLSAAQQLEALHELWEEQQAIWDACRARFAERMRDMLNENNLLGSELRSVVAERDALLAKPSKLFDPKLHDAAGRQAERAAFAAGLHHAVVLHRHTAKASSN